MATQEYIKGNYNSQSNYLTLIRPVCHIRTITCSGSDCQSRIYRDRESTANV